MTSLTTNLVLLAAALAIEAAVGYPPWLYMAIGHPVTWIGAMISALDKALNRERFSSIARRALGVLALLVIVAVPVALAYGAARLTGPELPALAVLALAASSLFAARSLDEHVAAVATALETGGLGAGRTAVSQIVGRDPQALDEGGVCRGAIESLAENFSDGVIAPGFWLAALGLPGLAAYKAVNTADSMIGHRTPRHEAFGWASARFDDLVNLPAARLSALLIILAACVLPGASPREAIRAVWRDAGTHRSPNAGWPEAAMAGALGFQLAGPRSYGGVMSAGTPMGRGRTELTATDIRQALLLYRLAIGLGWAMVAAILLAVG